MYVCLNSTTSANSKPCAQTNNKCSWIQTKTREPSKIKVKLSLPNAGLPHRVQIPPEFLGPGQQPSAGLVTLLTTAWVAGELHEFAAVHVGSYHESIAWIRRPILYGRTLMQFSEKFRNE